MVTHQRNYQESRSQPKKRRRLEKEEAGSKHALLHRLWTGVGGQGSPGEATAFHRVWSQAVGNTGLHETKILPARLPSKLEEHQKAPRALVLKPYGS